MYFPKDMNFQYFFFNTYIGYFLQALPIALAAGAVYSVLRFRGDRATPLGRKVFCCAFVCYLAGLVCLVLGLDLMGIFYYRLFYHMEPGREVRWFGGVFDLVPDFWRHIGEESIGNFLMFLPFGLLYPLAQKAPDWKKTVAAGFLTVLAIEVLQPVFGRAFDLNDILLNTLGVVASASVFAAVQRMAKRLHTPNL